MPNFLNNNYGPQESTGHETVPSGRRLSPGSLTFFAIVAIIVGISGGYIVLHLHGPAKTPVAAKPQDDNAQTLAAVGKLMLLPTDEQPLIATVDDLSKLKGQAFFASAAIGDKALFYSKAHKVILYSPAKNQIVNVAPYLATPTPSPR